MAIKIKVRKGRQIIVPVRFARAKGGDVDPGFPEIDDRGFPMGTRPGTWGANKTMRGPMMSIAQGDTVKIKVLRLDIDDSARLFVHSTNPQAAAIVGSPGPLVDGIFQLKGVLDTRNFPVKIEVRLGLETGAVLAELEPHIFRMRQVRVHAHLMTINTDTTVRTADSLISVFQDVNKVWRAAGIEFLYKPGDTTQDTITGLKVSGQVTTDFSVGDGHEIDQVLALNPADDAVNVYLVAKMNESAGVTTHKPGHPPHGVIIRDKEEPHTFAHELGHFLSLAHASDDAQGNKFRDDIWTERQVMYFNMTLIDAPFILDPLALNDGPQPAYRHDVGYGFKKVGALIPVKDLPGEPFDGCVAASRRRALDPF